MAMLRTLISLAAITMVVGPVGTAMAANHTVGGPNGGWDQSTDLQTWASAQTFMVGDNLIFTYSPMHDVSEVSKADYDSCQSTSPLSTNSGGNTAVPLTTPGKRYFICGTIGHCSSGMKLQVNVLATAAPPQAASTAPTSAPAPLQTSVPSLAPSPSTPSDTAAPVFSPVNSPAPEIAPALSPEDPSTDAAASPPALDFPGISPAGGVRESLPPPPSSANKVNVVAGSAAAFAVIFIMMLVL